MKDAELVPPGMVFMADNVVEKDNILGVNKQAKSKWAKKVTFPAGRDTIFFAGCGYQYSGELESLMGLIRKADSSSVGAERLIGMAGLSKKMGINASGLLSKVTGKRDDEGAQPLRDAVTVLKKLGLEFGYMGEDEPCCGGILYFAGFHKEFAENSRRVYDTLKSAGIRQIISLVPSCTYTLRELASKYYPNDDITVKHFIEVVLENLDKVELRFPKEAKVTYHDPCQLARYLGLIEEPRQILKAIKGIEFVEPEWTKGEWSTCCGGGGGFEAVFPEISTMLATNRARELVETGADTIVTNCPGCIMQLETGLKALNVRDVKVLDLTQVLAMSMEG